jgi:hypothetical protein
VKGSAIFEETMTAETTVKPIINGKGTIFDYDKAAEVGSVLFPLV